MSDLKILRGRDINATVNGQALFGLTELSTAHKPQYHEVYEYLSASPYARVPAGSICRIKLYMHSLFSRQIPMDGSFTLTVGDDEYEYIYSGCRVLERNTAARGDKSIEEVFLIEAESQTERVIDDE